MTRDVAFDILLAVIEIDHPLPPVVIDNAVGLFLASCDAEAVQ